LLQRAKAPRLDDVVLERRRQLQRSHRYSSGKWQDRHFRRALCF
jgi:hypothetical protein